MSWKIYLIVITNSINTQLSEISKIIGINNLTSRNEVTMMEAQYKEKGVSIGKSEDKIFIVSQQLVFDLLEKDNSDLKQKLVQSFPNSEIAILTLGYGVHGYSIIQDKKVIRTKVGFDLKSSIDLGDKLSEEIEAYNEIYNDKELIAEIKEEAPDDFQGIINENTGEDTVFRLSKRYFKERIDKDGSDFDKITLIHYE